MRNWKIKKILLFIFIVFIFPLVLISCKENTPDDPNNNPNNPDDTPSVTPVGFTIHYKRTDSSYDSWGLWLWEDGKDGALYSFEGTDDYGAYVTFDFSEWSESLVSSKLGFIIRKQASWTKDYDGDRFVIFKDYKVDLAGYYQIYLRQGDKTIYTNAEGEVADIVQTFEIIVQNNTYYVWFELNKDYKSFELSYDGETLVSSNTENDPNIILKTTKKLQYSLGTNMPDITKDFKLKVVFEKSGLIQVKYADKVSLYKTKDFALKYTYTGELGAIYSKNETIFRVWSPVSSEIKLRVYESGTPTSAIINGVKTNFAFGNDSYQEYVMERIENGCYEYTVLGDLGGKYYTYVVTNSSFTEREVVDPYAKSTGINGYRGMIVDFSKTNPIGWDDVKIHNIPAQSLTIYETHVADITSSSTWGGTPENAKLFKGLYETGTTYTSGDVTVTTGFDHIKELGVNALQLIPIFDQANDERADDDITRTDGSKRAFNWGYNPLNYNSLDGIYSSDPYDGYAKIKEFKELVKAYNEAGINIIMDVVYNHVAGLDGSNFDVLMPKYYFRYRSGVASNGSGCGNETASELSMFRKFMIDSTEFWATEYKLGGFRFDLMGVHDVETMNQLAENLHKINPYITVFGEPWTGGTTALSTTAATQANMALFKGYGQFNDKMRDSLIKGGLCGVSEKGWVSGNVSTTNDLINGLKGITLASVIDPTKSISYTTCHDNYTLYDRIRAAGISNPDTIKKQAMLANSCVFTSQGITFMLAGEEMLRTKGGDSNSYQSSYEVNQINYALKVRNLDMFENYKKLIALKQNTAVFGKSAEEILKDVEITKNDDGSLITMKIIDRTNNVEYIICHSNGLIKSLKLVNLSGYTLYLDTLNTDNLVLTDNLRVQNYQTIIAYREITD